jgi:hypothetical protein
MDPKDCLIVSNHHRRSIFFEESSRILWKGGFTNIYVHSTGKHEWGPYEGKSNVNWDASLHLSYDQGMVEVKKATQKRKRLRGGKMILLIDNDLFFSDTKELQQFIDEFEAGGYDFVCHFTDPVRQKKVWDGKIIHPVDDLVIHPGQHGIPTPQPHWHSTYCAISRRVWDQVSEDATSHHRKLIAAIHGLGGKFGHRVTKYRDQLCHIGKEWFHVGALMRTYYIIEEADWSKLNRNSPRDKFTVGYFAAQQRFHGDISCYPQHLRNNVRHAYKMFGGYAECLESWDEWTKDSIMATHYKTLP